MAGCDVDVAEKVRDHARHIAARKTIGHREAQKLRVRGSGRGNTGEAICGADPERSLLVLVDGPNPTSWPAVRLPEELECAIPETGQESLPEADPDCTEMIVAEGTGQCPHGV